MRQTATPSTPPTGLFPLSFAGYEVKLATTQDELQQVHRLNFDTFVEEIGQHTAPPGQRHLVDKYDAKNRYFVVKREADVAAMLAVHNTPPFSTAGRLRDPAILEQFGDRLIEVRLLAVRPALRHSRVLLALFWALYRYAQTAHYSHLLISGVREQLDLYRRLGFHALGPPVQSGDAWFAPMAMALTDLPGKLRRLARTCDRQRGAQRCKPQSACISLLPGPAQFSDRVTAALSETSMSHRSPEFIQCFEETRSHLAALANTTSPPALIPGNGTLANDAIAANLAADDTLQRGLILSTGEFGDRLVRQSKLVGLQFDVLSWPWGAVWDLDAVADAFRRRRPDWVWGVHCESSTGVLNNLAALAALAREFDVPVCADCISSLGSVPLDLSDVYLASAVSGKCLGSAAGIAIVFSNDAARRVQSGLADTFDLSAHANAHGPRRTLAWQWLAALSATLRDYQTPDRAVARFAAYADLGRAVREGLREMNVEPLATNQCASPALTTFRPPHSTPEEFARTCRRAGFEINAYSSYLISRGLAQIATMGAISTQHIADLFAKLRQ